MQHYGKFKFKHYNSKRGMGIYSGMKCFLRAIKYKSRIKMKQEWKQEIEKIYEKEG